MTNSELQLHENNLAYHVKAATVGVNVELRKARVGRSVGYLCPTCGGKCRFSLDDLKMAFNSEGEDKLLTVQEYQKVAEDVQKLETTQDFLEYLVKRAQVSYKHRHSYKQLRKNAQTAMELKCPNCNHTTVFNVAAESTSSTPLSYGWLKPQGELLSSRDAENVSNFFEIHDSDGFEHLTRLAEALELMQALDARALSWKGHDKLVWKINWDKSDSSALECAREYTQKLVDLRADVQKAPLVASRLKELAEQTLVVAFKTHAGRYASQSLASAFSSETFVIGLQRRLRRQLAEHLLWIYDQIYGLVTRGEDVK